MLTDQAILRHIERQPQRSAGYKQLIRELNLRGAERQLLADRLRALVQSTRLIETARDRYTLAEHAATRQNLIAGRLTMHRDGYGFVIPNAGQRATTPPSRPVSPKISATPSPRENLASRSPRTTPSRSQPPISGDVFIPPPSIGAAMHGDQVLVELTRRRDDGRAEGRILRVLTRGNPTVVGAFHYGPHQNYVIPFDEKVTQQIIIPRGMEWPAGDETSASADSNPPAISGAASSSSHPGSNASAKAPANSKAARSHSKSSSDRVLGSEVLRRDFTDLENVVVEIEITDWPSPTENPRGRVLEVLGYEDDFGVDVEIVIRKFHLPHRFPVECLQEEQNFDPVIPATELRHRRDFRALPIVTIDGETARDFDDAVHVRHLDNGNFELQVHIADVAHYVREGTAIDLEARLRGTSVYFPDRAVPMLPIELSTDLCSLRPQVDRMVLSCIMEIDHHGEIAGYALSQGVIRSAERMTYTNVNLILEGDPALRRHYGKLVSEFELMRDLALILNRKRVRRGSIDFDLPEPVIEFDEHGLMSSIARSERNIAHRLIEEFMLAANECVASYLEGKGIPSLYRIHEKPDPKRVMDFETTAARFGYSLGVGPLPVKRVQFKAERRERYGSGRGAKTLEIPEDIHITPRMYQKLTQKIAGKPEERILSYLMLRSLKQARYSEKNEGHFALAAPTYTHFTSPIRRYPDLVVHRILKDVLRNSAEDEDHAIPIGAGSAAHSETPSPWSKRGRSANTGAPPKPGLLGWGFSPISPEELPDIADESSQAERRADEAERELMEWKKMKFMEERIGDDFAGLIVSVTKFGLFVELNDMFIEGLVPLASLTDDRYMYHENTRQIIGQRTRKTYSLGDPIRVLVDRIDRTQHRIQFAVVEESPARAPRRHKKK